MRRMVHLITTAGATAVLLTSAVASAQFQKAEVRIVERPAEAPAQGDTVKKTVPAEVGKEALRIEPARKAVRVEAFQKGQAVKNVAPFGMVELFKMAVPFQGVIGRQIGGAAMPAAPAFVIDQAQKDAMTENMARQLRPFLRAELHLIRTVCKPSKEAQAKIAEEGEKAMTRAAGDMAVWQLKAQQGIGGAMPKPSATIQEALVSSIRSSLSPEQAKAYVTEVEKREADDKEIAARNLVARFDRLLNLDSEQRDKIAAELVKSSDPMTHSLDSFMYNNHEYLPAVRDRAVVGFLDPQQKELWRNAQKVHIGGSHFGINGINLSDADFAEEDPPVSTIEAIRKQTQKGFGGLFNALGRLPHPGMGMMPAAPMRVAAPVMVVPGIRIRAEPARPVAPAQPE